MDHSFIQPGKASWSWALLKDNSVVYDAEDSLLIMRPMHWQYCLVDVDWDTRIGYDKIKELAAYAATKKVGLICGSILRVIGILQSIIPRVPCLPTKPGTVYLAGCKLWTSKG